jgi:hypothetical protein
MAGPPTRDDHIRAARELLRRLGDDDAFEHAAERAAAALIWCDIVAVFSGGAPKGCPSIHLGRG